MATLYIATESFHTLSDGLPVTIIRGRTLVSDRDDLYKRFPDKFKLAESQFRPAVEQATAAPGETRDVKLK